MSGPAGMNSATLHQVETPATERSIGHQAWLAPALSVVVVLALWQAAIVGFEVEPYVFPAPSAILASLYRGVLDGSYLYAMCSTLGAVLLGFALGSTVAFVLAVSMVAVPPVGRVIYPWVVTLQTVPKVAIAPLMIVWFGFGLQSKLIVVALTCLFPVLVNTITGLRATEADRLALVRSMTGTRLQLLRHVEIPSALPYVFAGLSTAMVLAVIGSVVAEFVGARSGVGVLVLQANMSLDLASVFALLTLLAISGVILNLLIDRLGRQICFWSGRPTR
ncbi:MAG: ABC transporter permease [Azospirillum brasilense]|nr:MAG: ABC transporter permease [Azospirillum brasilense]